MLLCTTAFAIFDASPPPIPNLDRTLNVLTTVGCTPKHTQYMFMWGKCVGTDHIASMPLCTKAQGAMPALLIAAHDTMSMLKLLR